MVEAAPHHQVVSQFAGNRVAGAGGASNPDVTVPISGGGDGRGSQAGSDVGIFVGGLVFGAVVLNRSYIAAGLVHLEHQSRPGINGVHATPATDAKNGVGQVRNQCEQPHKTRAHPPEPGKRPLAGLAAETVHKGTDGQRVCSAARSRGLAISTAYTWGLPSKFPRNTIQAPSGVKLTFGSRA